MPSMSPCPGGGHAGDEAHPVGGAHEVGDGHAGDEVHPVGGVHRVSWPTRCLQGVGWWLGAPWDENAAGWASA